MVRKNDISSEKMVTFQCDCKCAMLVIDKTVYSDGDIYHGISIQDSRYNHNYNTVWGRIKRACKILFGKPIYYNDICIVEPKVFNDFVEEINELVRWQGDK